MRFAAVARAGACAALLAATAAHAHHSSSIYDFSKKVEFEAVVVAVDWTNPHVSITVQQKADAGGTVAWEIESSPPAGLRRLGWSRDTLKAGDVVRVAGSPTRDAAA